MTESQEDTVKITFYCKHCNENHSLNIEKDYFVDIKFQTTYTYVHGSPQIAAILYIDKNHVVRAVEFSEVISTEDESEFLSNLLNQSKSLTLSSIPADLIYGFQLMEQKIVLKMFYHQGYENKIQFGQLKKIFKTSAKLIKTGETCTEFYIKYSDLWAGGVTMMDYMFIMVVDSSIDIDHLKTQIMAIFETLLNDFA